MYSAIICRIKTRPHGNADNLVLGDVHGFQVVTSKDTVDGTLGIFFPTDGQLSVQYAEANDCVSRVDDNGNKAGGYFARNRKVRSQKFRGERSDGYFAPLSSLSFAGGDIESLVEGTTLDEFNGVPICNKFVTEATLKHANQQPKTRRDNPYFAKHVETEQLKYQNSLPENAIVYITEKLHGTSGRFGFVMDDEVLPKTFWQRLFHRPARTRRFYNYLLGTRNTIVTENKVGFYGTEGFRRTTVKELKGHMHQGEIFYYELVGFTDTGASIMGEPSTKVLDKDLQKKYGPNMRFKYGQLSGTTGLYVYRITKIAEDGSVVELPWPQVKRRCKQLGLNTVPELRHPMVITKHGYTLYGYTLSDINHIVELLLEGESTLDHTHIREGVVLRVESEAGTDFYKSKSFTFGVLEGYLKDQESYVDVEEAS